MSGSHHVDEEGWGKYHLDYEEEVQSESHPRRPSEEDEVKVHAAVDIEEGELSSGEEGEIKDASGESPDHTHHTTQPSLCPSPDAVAADDITECDPLETKATEEADSRGEEKEEEEEKVEKEKDEEEKDEEEEEEEEEEVSDVESSSRRKLTRTRSPVRGSRGTAVCRHFLQGKCSWGRECRFSHDDRSLSSRLPRPHPSLHGLRGRPDRFLDPYLGPPEPDFMRLPPLGAVVPHHLPPPLPREAAPLFLPYKEQRRGGKVSQVEEESEGWYRLRTVARDWSSDEDEPQTQKSSKRKKRGESEQKKGHGSRRESSDTPSPKAEEEKVRKKRKNKERSPAVDKPSHREKATINTERDSGSEERSSRRKKRRQSSSSESSEAEPRYFPHHQRPLHYPPGSDRFFHSDGHFPPFGPPRHLAPPLDHRPLPFAPLPPHGHYPDQYGPPPYQDWHRQPPSPPHRGRHIPHRDHSASPKRRRRHKASSSSPSSSPDGHQHRRKQKRASSQEKHLNRKEQLLQELSVINKVIERKKKKKSSSKRSD